MNEIDSESITQLLLSPLYLINHLLGTVVPGSLLILLLAHKGNTLLRDTWSTFAFGYKTKLAIFLMIAFVLGCMLRIPVQLLALLTKPFAQKTTTESDTFLNHLSPAVKKAIIAAVTDGVLLAKPALLDRLALIQSEATFYIGAGTALLVAAVLPGDGPIRWLEGLTGIAMFTSGIIKGSKYQEQAIGLIGIGIVSVLGTMTPQQINLAKSAIKILGLGNADSPSIQPEASPPQPPDSI